MFPAESKKSKKSHKSADAEADADAPEPVDVLVDTVIGFLEKATAYMRAVANQVFSLLTGSVQESTIELMLAVCSHSYQALQSHDVPFRQQLERRDPEELLEDEDDMQDGDEDSHEDEDEDDSSSSEVDEVEEDEEDLDEEADPELRRKIEEALAVNGIQAATGDSDGESEEELMDDDQMMAIDAQLAAAFKARADEKKLGKGTLLPCMCARVSLCLFMSKASTLSEKPLITKIVYWISLTRSSRSSPPVLSSSASFCPSSSLSSAPVRTRSSWRTSRRASFALALASPGMCRPRWTLSRRRRFSRRSTFVHARLPLATSSRHLANAAYTSPSVFYMSNKKTPFGTHTENLSSTLQHVRPRG